MRFKYFIICTYLYIYNYIYLYLSIFFSYTFLLLLVLKLFFKYNLYISTKININKFIFYNKSIVLYFKIFLI